MLKKVIPLFLLATCSLKADATLAPARLEVKDGYNMYLEGQFLWWLSQNDSLYFCQDGPSQNTTNFNGHFKRMNTGFKPGWKATFGGLMAYDHWDIHFTWTHFDQHSAARSTNQSFYIGNTHGMSSLASYVKAKYYFDLNMVDGIMTRPSWMGERLALSPYVGIRGTWLDQTFKTKAGLQDFAQNKYDIYNRAKSDFRGAGLLAGFGLRYELKSGWCIEGNFLTSGIYGKFVNYYSGYMKKSTDTSSFNSTNRDYFSRDPHQSMLFDVEYKLGIAYNRFIYSGRYHLGGGVAWEEIFFLNGNRLPIWSSSITNGQGPTVSLTNPSTLLNMQGITVRFVFGF